MKQITITVPDNCELKKDGNTYTVVEKEKKLTYENVARVLFLNKYGYFINMRGTICNAKVGKMTFGDANNCTSKRQVEKLLAINKLMNVAKYLNDSWQPDWTNPHERGWYLSFRNKDKIEVNYSNYKCGDIYFRTEELAEQAIEILGEETIKLALCTNY